MEAELGAEGQWGTSSTPKKSEKRRGKQERMQQEHSHLGRRILPSNPCQMGRKSAGTGGRKKKGRGTGGRGKSDTDPCAVRARREKKKGRHYEGWG